jgi:spoIIIJ-associated protein
MNFVEKTGRTVDEALELALIQLDASRENVEVEVLEEDSKGFLGLFGNKEAKIRVTLKVTVDSIAEDFLKSVFDNMGVENTSIHTSLENDVLNIKVEGENMAILIGRRGQTLDSLQYLTSLVVNKGREDYVRVILDTENYRKKRKETLERLANKLAYKAKKMRKDIVLEPMNPYERRIIHSALQGNPHVSTRSEGDEPYRKVIIFLNK